ncbi:MAG: hypothetical protein JJ899_11050 [Alphaproteobacteria bacterium]|nr:hypothetical protein [Alphaproteobacteria bacterium]
MSEATLHSELEGDGAAQAGPPESVPAEEIVLAGRYKIQPGVVLPHLNTPSARAYVTLDTENPKAALYALVLDRNVPARHHAIINSKRVDHEAMLKPVRWGRIDWTPTGQEEIAIVLPQPPGQPLMQGLEDTVQPWFVRDIKRDLVGPVVELLRRIHDVNLTHRNLRPTNLFRNPEDGSVVPGQIYSSPAGYDQPHLFEPIERAQCHALARGTGDAADDMYALGVTILILALGHNPVAGLDPEEVLRRRIQLGSYSALLGDNKLHTDLAPVVRSLLRDDAHERWGVSDLSNWAQTGRVNPSQPSPVVRADRPFEFDGEEALTARELAHLLSRNWSEASKVVTTSNIEHWVDRSLKDRDLTKEIGECSQLERHGPKRMTPDLLLSRVLTKLDPAGPIRFRSVVAMPDGLATANIPALWDKGMARDLTDLIAGKITSFWHEAQARPKPWMISATEVAEKMSVFLSRTGVGFSIERSAYELNPALPCLSPLLRSSAPLQDRELIETMERHAGDGNFLFDRHIAAFLGARIAGSVDRELTEIGNADEESARRIAQLRLLAYVQSKNSSTSAKKLYAMFLEHLEPVLNEYRNVPMREKLRRAARKAASRGNLNDLVRIVDNRKNRAWDQRGFEYARRRHAQLERSIHRLTNDATMLHRQSQRLGHRISASIASMVAVATAAVLVLMYTG